MFLLLYCSSAGQCTMFKGCLLHLSEISILSGFNSYIHINTCGVVYIDRLQTDEISSKSWMWVLQKCYIYTSDVNVSKKVPREISMKKMLLFDFIHIHFVVINNKLRIIKYTITSIFNIITSIFIIYKNKILKLI